MTIILGIFIGLMGVLLFAFFSFGKLVKIEYRKYRHEWTIDGKPRKFFWRPPESSLFSSSIAMQILTFRWLFRTPEWIRSDAEAVYWLRKLRLSALVFNAGIVVWFFVIMIITEKGI